MEMTNFTVGRAVLRNNYWSCILIGPYRFWVISPWNLTLFTRQFLSGRHARADHKTIKSVFILLPRVLFNIPPTRCGLAYTCFSLKECQLAFMERRTYGRQADIYYMINPPFNSLVWGSLRLTPTIYIESGKCWVCGHTVGGALIYLTTLTVTCDMLFVPLCSPVP